MVGMSRRPCKVELKYNEGTRDLSLDSPHSHRKEHDNRYEIRFEIKFKHA